MKNKIFIVLIIIFSSANAGDVHYDCTIKNVYKLNDDGTLVKNSEKEDIYTGTFSVSRLTGDIVGVTMPTMKASQKLVINNPGNSWQSFKAISIYEHPNGNKFNGIEVMEDREGIEKPFYAISNVGVISGACK